MQNSKHIHCYWDFYYKLELIKTVLEQKLLTIPNFGKLKKNNLFFQYFKTFFVFQVKSKRAMKLT